MRVGRGGVPQGSKQLSRKLPKGPSGRCLGTAPEEPKQGGEAVGGPETGNGVPVLLTALALCWEFSTRGSCSPGGQEAMSGPLSGATAG